jgi:acyl dehydratase
VEMEVTDTKPSNSRPEIGVVTSLVSVKNDRNNNVMQFICKVIFSRS